MSLAELCRGPLPVGGHPHWKVISWRTFDAPVEHRPASWVVTGLDEHGIFRTSTDCPLPVHELIIGVPRQPLEPLPTLLAQPDAPGCSPRPGYARIITVTDELVWLAVPQDWFHHHFIIEEPA